MGRGSEKSIQKGEGTSRTGVEERESSGSTSAKKMKRAEGEDAWTQSRVQHSRASLEMRLDAIEIPHLIAARGIHRVIHCAAAASLGLCQTRLAENCCKVKWVHRLHRAKTAERGACILPRVAARVGDSRKVMRTEGMRVLKPRRHGAPSSWGSSPRDDGRDRRRAVPRRQWRTMSRRRRGYGRRLDGEAGDMSDAGGKCRRRRRDEWRRRRGNQSRAVGELVDKAGGLVEGVIWAADDVAGKANFSTYKREREKQEGRGTRERGKKRNLNLSLNLTRNTIQEEREPSAE
ncbi:hypothetical protein B0H19DRAFT_1228103 [Mycena capillaripes]|nr:hypothetical protein B0H19DRAFT_1228103 [Mycena capillaripes]